MTLLSWCKHLQILWKIVLMNKKRSRKLNSEKKLEHHRFKIYWSMRSYYPLILNFDLKRAQRWHENVPFWTEYESVDAFYGAMIFQTDKTIFWNLIFWNLFLNIFSLMLYSRKTWIALFIGNPKYLLTFWKFQLCTWPYCHDKGIYISFIHFKCKKDYRD